MKIFHLSDHLPNYHANWGGAEQVAWRYIKLLSDSGKVNLRVGITKPTRSNLQPGPTSNQVQPRRVRVIEDFFPKRFQIYVTGLKNRILSFDPLAFFHLLLLFGKEKPEIVHLHKTNKISLAAILAAKISGAKTVLGMYDYWYLCPGGMLVDQKGNLCQKFHGPWCHNCDAVPDFRFLLPLVFPFRRPIFDFFYRRVDAFTVLSNSQKKILINYGLPEKKIFLIRQVFDIKPAKEEKLKKNLILFAGWVDPRKGLAILIEAMPKVLKVIPTAKLVVLELQGIKTYKEKILKMIAKLDVGDKIVIKGRLTREEFEKKLVQAEVVVVPEQWENMSPVIIVEAMSMEKVIVASRIGGIPEFIKDGQNGLLAERKNPSDFAQKIIWVLKHPKEARVLGKQAAKDIVKLCDKRKILTDLLKLYRSL